MATTLMAVRLEEELNLRLDNLAKKTGRKKSFYVKEAIKRFLEDMEDIYIALERLEKPGKRYSLEEVKKMLELE